jgi:multiple sugar transport system substrate-binding protein
VADALTKPTTVTVWDWSPQTVDVAKAFMAKYPQIKVNVVNAGTNSTEYTKLQNVIKAGSGVPDLAQVEYYAIPQFALQGGLVDLAKMNVSSLASQFTKSAWGGVSIGSSVYGIPQDSAPMAMFYRTDVFAKYGLTVPKTWDEYIADAKKLKAANSSLFMTPDSGDPGFTTSMIWQAGGHPFTVNGTKVTINLHDAGTQKWVNVWNQLVENKLVDTKTPGWSAAWTKNITDGVYATILSGAWWPGILESSNKPSSGKWAVAPMPQYTAGGTATAQNGGSSLALPKGGKNQLAALGFAEWMNTSHAGIGIWAAGGAFPSTNADLDAPSYVNAAIPFFNGQKANQVLVEAGKNVLPGWSYLPFEVYANSIFGDTVGKAYAANSDLAPALAAWQSQIATFGKAQGYSVTSS